jgi:hypothetical protein
MAKIYYEIIKNSIYGNPLPYVVKNHIFNLKFSRKTS